MAQQWPPAWAQPQGYDPRQIYGPPQHYQQPPAFAQQPAVKGWWSNSSSTKEPPTALRSPKYPNLNPILATDSTHVRWDVKTPPVSGILGSTFVSSRHQFALAQPTTHIRLMSKSFPWQIELLTPANTTCEDIWTAVYTCLQQVIEDSEWGFISQDKRIRETIEKASKKRMERDNSADPRPRRVDYLGEATMFKGLEKDDDFAKVRLYPGNQPLAETWVIKLDK